MRYEEIEALNKLTDKFADKVRANKNEKLPEEFRNIDDKNIKFGRHDLFCYKARGLIKKQYLDGVAGSEKWEFVPCLDLGVSKTIYYNPETFEPLKYVMGLSEGANYTLIQINQNFERADMLLDENQEAKQGLEKAIEHLQKEIYVPKNAGEIITEANLDLYKKDLNSMLRTHALKGYWGIERNIVKVNAENWSPSYVFNMELVKEIENKSLKLHEEFTDIKDMFDNPENKEDLLTEIEKNKKGIGSKLTASLSAETLFAMAQLYFANGCGCYEYNKKQYLERFETALLRHVKTAEPAKKAKCPIFMDF